jgi:hypothetical protein
MEKEKIKKQIRVEGVPPSNRGQDARDTFFFPKVCLTFNFAEAFNVI